VPIVIKPIGNINNPTDGFDPEVPYQMIPFRQTREMAVQTGDFKAEMSFTVPDVSGMSNFRILRQSVPNLFPLPRPGIFVSRIALPERSIVQFTLSGRASGRTILEGRDRPGSDTPLLKPDFALEVSVKRPEIRRFAVCYVFDQINRDRGQRLGFGTLFEEISKVYEKQANCSTINIDGHLSSTDLAKSLTLPGTSGKTFNMLDRKLLGRVVGACEAQFPGLFAQVHAVLFPVTVPLQVLTVRPLGMQLTLHRSTDGTKFQTVFVGPSQNRDQNALRHTLAHEIGHSFGLGHNPAQSPPGPSKKKSPDPDLLPVSMHNLMFPTTLVQSSRINRNQIENIHSFIPPFRDLEI